MASLNRGDTFPALSGVLADGTPFHVPDDLSGHHTVLLFYRGHW
jgi:peroxiredoxin